MTVTEFIKRKNEIVKRVTGLTLVPDDQIEECEQIKLQQSVSFKTLGAGICPYCMVYNKDESCICNDCPMNKANNDCSEINSTWREINPVWRNKATESDMKELEELVKQYNKELKDENTN